METQMAPLVALMKNQSPNFLNKLCITLKIWTIISVQNSKDEILGPNFGSDS